MNRIAREEAVRNFAVLHGDSIDEPRAAQRELCHVEAMVMAAGLELRASSITEHLVRKVWRELIMACGYRCMGCKDTLFPNGLDEIGRDRLVVGARSQFLLQQRENKQRRVPFIHVESLNPPLSERPQQTETPKSQHHFLA